MKIEILNNVTGKEFKAEFETEQELDSWVDAQLNKGMKCPWGKPEYEVLESENIAPNDRAEFIETVILAEEVRGDLEIPLFDENQLPILDQEGNPTVQILADQILQEEVIKYKFRIPCEYELFKDTTPLDKAPIYFAELREAREKTLRDTDWSQLADAPLSTNDRTYYREYRQYLRDLPLNYDNESITNWSIMTFDEFKTFKGYDL
jgi:hypothetical protein